MTNGDYKTALHIACSNNNKVLVKLLIDHGSDINHTTADEWTPLHIAVYNNNYNVVKYLLSQDPDITKKTDSDYSVMNIALEIKNNKVIKLLEKYIKEKNEKVDNFINHFNSDRAKKEEDHLRNELLSKSELILKEIKQGNVAEAINFIISKEIGLEYMDRYGCTVLHWASYYGYIDVVDELIKCNVELDKKNEKNGLNDNVEEYRGKIAKKIANLRGHKDIVKAIETKNLLNKFETVMEVLETGTDPLSNALGILKLF